MFWSLVALALLALASVFVVTSAVAMILTAHKMGQVGSERYFRAVGRLGIAFTVIVAGYAMDTAVRMLRVFLLAVPEDRESCEDMAVTGGLYSAGGAYPGDPTRARDPENPPYRIEDDDARKWL